MTTSLWQIVDLNRRESLIILDIYCGNFYSFLDFNWAIHEKWAEAFWAVSMQNYLATLFMVQQPQEHA